VAATDAYYSRDASERFQKELTTTTTDDGKVVSTTLPKDQLLVALPILHK
jgi:hypothetical protein